MKTLRTRMIVMGACALAAMPLPRHGLAADQTQENQTQAAPASQDVSDPFVLYASGDYGAAAGVALAHAQAVTDALAARALLAQARTSPRDARGSLVAQARDAARSAIARDPAVIEGQLQLAVALGYQGRAMGNLVAHQRGLADEAKSAIDAALALAPDNAWALALLGSWHLEIVRGAGPLLASTLYGADQTTGIEALRKAAATPGASLIVLHQCALQLLAHDADAFGAEAQRILLAARARQPVDAFERHTARQADKLLRALRTGNRAMLARAIDRAQLSY